VSGWHAERVTESAAIYPLRPRRLIARPVRPAAVAVLVLAVAGTAALGVALAGRRTFTTFDLRWGIHIAHLFRGHSHLALHLANIGGLLSVTVCTMVIAVAMLVLRRLRGVALAVLAVPIATSVTEWVLKPLIGRAPFGVDTYPSGHSTAAFAIATVVVILVLDETSPRPPRVVRLVTAAVALVVACAAALGLVAAGFHFVTDTIGGAGVGIATTLLLALGIDAIADRRVTRR
jgi:membrane-associated phospholipid phosphatase